MLPRPSDAQRPTRFKGEIAEGWGLWVHPRIAPSQASTWSLLSQWRTVGYGLAG